MTDTAITSTVPVSPDLGVPAATPILDLTAPLAQTAATSVPVPPPVAAPAPAPLAIDYNALAAALVKAGAVPTTSAPASTAAADKPPVATNQFKVGSLVTHQWHDPYSGKTVSRHGVVVAINPDEGAGATSEVAWLDGPSGPIGDQYLAAV